MLVFWDIDGTLITTGRAGIFAWEDAFAEITGVTVDLADFDTAGHPDHGIARRLLAEFAQLPEPDPQLVSDLVRRYEALLPAALGRRKGQVLPNVREILERLAATPQTCSLLLTGNTERGARAKLTHYRLLEFFRGGGFSERDGDRAAIARAALEHAKATGCVARPGGIYVVGDTPHDVACGSAIGARSIAVATGRHTMGELAAVNPWRTLPELPPANKFLSILNEAQVPPMYDPVAPARPESCALVAAPFPFALRNFLAIGIPRELKTRLGLRVEFISPYQQPTFLGPDGHDYVNHHIRAVPGAWAVPMVEGVSLFDRALKSIHMTGFSLEYPDGSLTTMLLSRRPSPQWLIARALTLLAPRRSWLRRWLRALYAAYRPARVRVEAVFDAVQPSVVLVASPGHMWLDHIVLDEARRRRIPSVCVVLSWDNLYSRGPMSRRPDHLMVWSEEMRQQAIDVHQFPADRMCVVGALQFQPYATPVAPLAIARMRDKIGLAADEPYLAYVCGARTAQYDVEDVTELISRLRAGPYRDLRVVVRPHPQGARTAYENLLPLGVLLDRSPDLIDPSTSPEAIDADAIRHMSALLKDARFVVSSWGTTALLEACVFDTASVQLRWMDALPRAAPEEVQRVRDFQRYIHMRAFDATGARPYCDDPADLNRVLADLEMREVEYSVRRAAAVQRLICLPLGEVVDRVCAALRPIVTASAPRGSMVWPGTEERVRA
jgi:phosphoglycolate phosphatase